MLLYYIHRRMNAAQKLVERFTHFIFQPQYFSEGLEPGVLIYAVGDIHGRNDLLGCLIKKIEADIDELKDKVLISKIKIVFLGDYIDRGHDSRSVIEQLINLRIADADLVFLMGNHEDTMISFMKSSDIGATWGRYGADETLASYGVPKTRSENKEDNWESKRLALHGAMPLTHNEFLNNLELMHIHEPYVFVHAGINPKVALENQKTEDILWIRDAFLKNDTKLPYVVVHGHTPSEKPVWDGRRIGLDTGAYISNKLSAVRLWKDRIYFLST